MAIEPPADTGSLLTQKAGPLPMWGWGVVILGAAYGYKLYKDHKGVAARTNGPSAGYDSANLPSNIQPQFTVVDEGGSQSYVNSPITTVGRQYVDTGASGVVVNNNVDNGSNNTTTTVAPPPPPPPAPAPVPVPQHPAPQGQWLTVTKWHPGKSHQNEPSTLSGLALAAYGNPNLWHKIWNAPQNADLVRRRGDPTKIQPGDKFWAPK